MVAMTEFAWVGTTIRFNSFLSKFPHEQCVKDYVEEMIGVRPTEMGISYTQLREFWRGRRPTEVERPQFVRSFLLLLLLVFFFPLSGSKVNYCRIPVLEDLSKVKDWNWPRAFLGQIYHGLDVYARGLQHELKAPHLLILIWAFEYGLLRRPVLPDGDLNGHFLERWTGSWKGMYLEPMFYREMLRQLRRDRVVDDPWMHLGHYASVLLMRNNWDDRRFVMESPRSQDWYFGERVRDWRVRRVADRPVPPPLRQGLYWPWRMSAADRALFIDGMGTVECSVAGSYTDFMRGLLPVCPRLDNRDTSDLLQRDPDDDEDDEGGADDGGAGEQEYIPPPTRRVTRKRRVHTAGETSASHEVQEESVPSHVAGFVEGRLLTHPGTRFSRFEIDGSRQSYLLGPPMDPAEIVPPDATHVSVSEHRRVADMYISLRDLYNGQGEVAATIIRNERRRSSGLEAEIAGLRRTIEGYERRSTAAPAGMPFSRLRRATTPVARTSPNGSRGPMPIDEDEESVGSEEDTAVTGRD